MKKNDTVLIIPYGKDANLRIRKDKIVATVSCPGSDHIDVYAEGTVHPWHITGVPSDAIIGMIWGGDDE